MKEYILIILFVIIIFFLLRPVKSNYGTADSYVTFFQVGKDIDPAVTTTVPSSDNALTVDSINSKLWGTGGFTSYWGFRKVLQNGGGGAVSYLTFANDTAATAALTKQADVLTTINFQGQDYTIPTVLFVKKSLTSPFVMYSFSSFTFTSAGYGGQLGPTPAQMASSYGITAPGYTTIYALSMPGTRGVQVWTVPETRNYTFLVAGASGGTATTNSHRGGSGNIISGIVNLTIGTLVYIIVGQAGASGPYQAGGGGGTFVFKSSISLANLLFAAGGGGGATHGHNGGDGTTTPSGGDGGPATNGYVRPQGVGGGGGISGNGGAGGWGGTVYLQYQSGSGNSINCTGGGGGMSQNGGGGGAGVGSITTGATFLGGYAGSGTSPSVGGFGGGGASAGGNSGGGGAGGGSGYSGGGGGGGGDAYGGQGGGGGSFIATSVTSPTINSGTNPGSSYYSGVSGYVLVNAS